jgi:hypothetical protein
MKASEDPRVVAIRQDSYINDFQNGTGIVSECWTDDEILADLEKNGIDTVDAAVEEFRFMESVKRDRMIDLRGAR